MNKNQKERYGRNIVLEEIGIGGQEKLLASKVLICGAGGLGSSVILNLAALGVGNIGIVDNDIVELSNLNRQYIHKTLNLGEDKVKSARDWVFNYNKDINVEIFKTRLDDKNYNDIIKGYDFIIDCFDSFVSKFLLNDIALETGKALIHGGVSEFRGQVMTILPKKSACLRCVFPQDEAEYPLKGVVSPTVSTIGSIQAMEALKIILNIRNPLTNRMLVYDGLKMSFKTLSIERAKYCKCTA